MKVRVSSKFLNFIIDVGKVLDEQKVPKRGKGMRISADKIKELTEEERRAQMKMVNCSRGWRRKAMAMPARIYVKYDDAIEGPDERQVVLMGVFNKLNYDLYMVHVSASQATGMPEKTLEFWRRD